MTDDTTHEPKLWTESTKNDRDFVNGRFKVVSQSEFVSEI